MPTFTALQHHVVALRLNRNYVARMDKENSSLDLDGDSWRPWPCGRTPDWEHFRYTRFLPCHQRQFRGFQRFIGKGFHLRFQLGEAIRIPHPIAVKLYPGVVCDNTHFCQYSHNHCNDRNADGPISRTRLEFGYTRDRGALARKCSQWVKSFPRQAQSSWRSRRQPAMPPRS